MDEVQKIEHRMFLSLQSVWVMSVIVLLYSEQMPMLTTSQNSLGSVSPPFAPA